MWPTKVVLVLFASLLCIYASMESNIDGAAFGRKKPEDTIPVVEIRGEGKPMTPSQIRSLEEASNGGPLDIKIDKTWVPVTCVHAANRLDFVTFHYKGYLEDGKKFDHTYGREPIKIQLGTGMTMPGLDKGLRGMCDQELRKVSIPYRLSRKSKSRIWKYIPNDEHWLTLNVEVLSVEEWSLRGQFSYMNTNNDTHLTESELLKGLEKQRKDYGKNWRNANIDNVLVVRYYIKYFDVNNDGRIDFKEYAAVMQRDLKLMDAAKMARNGSNAASGKKQKKQQRGRDPGVAWILDFNNDGIISYEELNGADETIQEAPRLLPVFPKEEL